MMRLWQLTYDRAAHPARGRALGVVGLSALVHSILIAGAVIATLPAAGVEPKSFENRIYYIPPPDHAPGVVGSQESIHFIALAPSGLGGGAVEATADETKPVVGELSPMRGRDEIHDTVDAPATIPASGADSTFTVLEVDTAVVRSVNSAAPAYPLELLMKGVMGSVETRYVVDTTGFADTASFQVLRATNAEFVTAVRAALPFMRFSPAKIGNIKVRQLVEQQFNFKIQVPQPPPKG
jgi:hypothetical protein